MATITPITRSRHATMRWRGNVSYAFAADRAVVPLVGAELFRAVLAFPVAFIRQGEGFVPAAVLGLESNRNLFVAEDGRWLGGYIPAALRGHPFVLGRTEEGQQLLCVDEASELVGEGPEGERFFEDDGTPAEAVRRVLDFLTRVEQNRAATAAICAALQARNLVEPWPITLKGDQGERKIEGLFRVNEAGLNALDDEAFLSVRKSGALPIAYTQLLSMQQLRVLRDLAAARVPRPQQPQLGPELDLSWLEGDGIKFNFGKMH